MIRFFIVMKNTRKGNEPLLTCVSVLNRTRKATSNGLRSSYLIHRVSFVEASRNWRGGKFELSENGFGGLGQVIPWSLECLFHPDDE